MEPFFFFELNGTVLESTGIVSSPAHIQHASRARQMAQEPTCAVTRRLRLCLKGNCEYLLLKFWTVRKSESGSGRATWMSSCCWVPSSALGRLHDSHVMTDQRASCEASV